MISKNINSKSNFSAYLSVKDNEKVDEELIIPLVNKFFNQKCISEFKCLAENADISDEDFQLKNFNNFFSYFYDYIVNDIYKNNNEVKVIVKYCITFDKQNCSKECKKTGIFYDEFFLYNEPVFYFIYVNIDDVFKFLRKSS